MWNSLPYRHRFGGMRSGAVLRRAEGVPEYRGEENHFSARKRCWDAPKDIIVSKLVAGLDRAVVEKNAEHPLLNKAQEDDSLEHDDLDEPAPGLHHRLHVAPGLQDCNNASADADAGDDLNPEMPELGLEARSAIYTCDFGCFFKDECQCFDDWILKDEQPGDLGPGKGRRCLFLSFHCSEALFVERPRRRRIL